MLVLARRPSQSIVFPELGITVQVVESSHSVARIGISAPREIKVLREEIYDKIIESAPDAFEPKNSAVQDGLHELKNRLNAANMAIHVARRHLESHRVKEAQSALDTAIGEFRDLNQLVKTRGEKPTRVLLVEDDNNERELLAGYLRSSGYEVTTAADGSEALRLLSSQDRPDAVLLDMYMPSFDGAKTIKLIRKTPYLSGLKVFAVSGTDPAELGVAIGPRGVDGWFDKPLNPDQLVQSLRRELLASAVA